MRSFLFVRRSARCPATSRIILSDEKREGRSAKEARSDVQMDSIYKISFHMVQALSALTKKNMYTRPSLLTFISLCLSSHTLKPRSPALA